MREPSENVKRAIQGVARVALQEGFGVLVNLCFLGPKGSPEREDSEISRGDGDPRRPPIGILMLGDEKKKAQKPDA